jgi:hypothetical protein
MGAKIAYSGGSIFEGNPVFNLNTMKELLKK